MPYNLVVSYIGYDKVITEINSFSYNVKLSQKAFMANEVVVSASRIKESYLSAPVSIEKMDIGKSIAISFGMWATDKRVNKYKRKLDKYIAEITFAYYLL